MRVFCSCLALALALTISTLAGTRAEAQANVLENQTTNLYVDAGTGSDSNPGTITAPFKTIQAAINRANTLNQSSIGSRVIVNPGIYREFVNVAGYSLTTAPLTVQAAVSGTAVIAGSDVLTGWSQQSPGIYSTSWTQDLGLCPVPSGWPTNFAPVALRSELVFVNGVALTQVMAQSDLQPGTFFVDDTAKMMYVSPDPGIDLATAVVEASTRTQTLDVVGRKNVVVRGLVFRHAANCINNSSAEVYGSDNVLIDGVQAVWNNWGGFGVFTSDNVTVQNSVANYNGGVGFTGSTDDNVLFQFNETDYNNWRGAQAAFYDWGMGGTKFFEMRNTSVQSHFSYNNQAQGLWFDTDNKDITISGATLSGNTLAALQIERNQGPVTLQNSSLCNSGTGLNVLTSQSLKISGNTFYNNGGTPRTNQGSIFVAGRAGGILINDRDTGQSVDLFTTGMVLEQNTIVDAAAGQAGFGTYLSGTDWTQFATTLSATNNTWYDPITTTSFKLPNGQKTDLPGWQSAVGTDFDSSWAIPPVSPAAVCTPPPPVYQDFAIDADNRLYVMAAGKALSTVHVNSFGFGPVNLKVTGVPAGVSASFSQQTLSSGTATLTFTSSMAAVAQSVPVTVWATSGSRVHSITFYLQVYPAQWTATVAWSAPPAITYGTPLGAAQLNATLSVPGTCTYSPAPGTVLTPGTKTLTATCVPTDSVNYSTPAPVTVSITVAKAPLTITAPSFTLPYHSAVPAIAPIFTGLVNGETNAVLTTQPSCSTAYYATIPAGSTPNVTCWGAAAANYAITYVPGVITVTQAPQTLTFNPSTTSVKFGNAAISLSATSTSGLAASFTGTAGVCSVSGTSLSFIGAGTCTVTANQAGNANYLAATPVASTITVTPAPLTITASSATVVYGAAVPTITPSYTGFVKGNTSASLTTQPTCTTAYTITSAVGSDPANNCSGAASPNYTITYVAGKVTINKAGQTISFTLTPTSVAYGVSPLALSATATSGLTVSYAASGPCTIAANALAVTGAGTCTVTASQAGNTNVNAATTVSRSVTISKAALTVTASSPTVTFGAPVPVITASFNGFVNADSAASLSTGPTCTTAYTTTSPAGSNPATSCSGAASPNYTITYVNGKVTVNAPAVTPAPTFSLAAGTYTGMQIVSISDAAPAVIYYTTDGSTPTTSSPVYAGQIYVTASTTLKAVALASGSAISGLASAAYTINLPLVNFANGFGSATGMQLNGKTTVAGAALQLTDGKTNEAASAFFSVPVNIAQFSTTFTLQQTAAAGDGMMFVIQNASAGAKVLGPTGSSLGYSYGPTQAGAILNSIGIKFDLYSNSGEGANSTGLYLNGAQPTKPAIDLTPSGVNLHSGNPICVRLSYDGTTLSMTITDTVTAKSFTNSWAVNIPQVVGSSTAYVGFTASTGGGTAVQQVLKWTY